MPIATLTLLLSLLPALSHAEQGPNADAAPVTAPTHRAADAERGGIKWLIIGMIAAQAADIATTSLALQRGCVETTYYGLQNRWAIGGMKGGGAIVLGMTLPFAHSKKPKLTKALAWAQIGSGALGAAINTARLPGCR
jgi:hypothetical protein